MLFEKMSHNHPRMCGFIRTVDASIHVSNMDLTTNYEIYTTVLKKDGTCMVSCKENKITTEEGAKTLLYKCQNETSTHWCIIYNGGIFNVIPDPRAKRNKGEFYFNYEEKYQLDYSVYRLS
jgi:hypothetical protein